jgi:hypothetical protein
MSTSWRAAGLTLLLTTSFGGALIAQVVVGPRPVYVQPVFRVWKLPPGPAFQEVRGALEGITKESRISVSPVPNVEQALRLESRRLTGKQLDKYCEYPIRNLEDWDPMSTFARDQIRAHRERWQHDWNGRVFLDVHFSSERGKPHKVLSYCYFYLRRRGGLFATSLAVYEQSPLGRLGDALGLGAEIAVEERSQVKPDLESVRYFSLVENECRTTSVHVDPESGRLSCAQHEGLPEMKYPGDLPLIKQKGKRAGGRKNG